MIRYSIQSKEKITILMKTIMQNYRSDIKQSRSYRTALLLLFIDILMITKDYKEANYLLETKISDPAYHLNLKLLVFDTIIIIYRILEKTNDFFLLIHMNTTNNNLLFYKNFILFYPNIFHYYLNIIKIISDINIEHIISQYKNKNNNNNTSLSINLIPNNENINKLKQYKNECKQLLVLLKNAFSKSFYETVNKISIDYYFYQCLYLNYLNVTNQKDKVSNF
jgi:hypothetical protein